MKFTMACSSWVREPDEIVLEILQRAETMPAVEQLMERTGLRRARIESTLRMWRKQIAMAEKRRRIVD